MSSTEIEKLKSDLAATQAEVATLNGELRNLGDRYEERVAERDDANKECGYRIGERDEARADAVALREQYGRLCDIFRVNMLRAFPDKSHAEIDAAIDAARKEGA